MDLERQKRREEIQKAFLTQLVCNLLDEGNCCFRDGDWRQATQQYGEGISVARYAQAEALVIPHELLESLYVNRAAAFYQMREYERGVQDCDSALCVSEGSRRALYRKALCLREMGQLREAYECGTKCLLTAPHDRQVTDLAQDLANKLGLKGRKAYVSPQTESTATDGESHGEASPPTGEVTDLSSAQCIPAPLATPIPVSDDPATPVVTPCTDLSDSPSNQGLPPMPYSVPVSEHTDECSNSVIKDKLDSLLDCIPKKVIKPRVFKCEYINNIMFDSANKMHFFFAGPRVMDYKYQPEAAHRCKRDVLLCRLKNTDDPTWKRIRPRPARNNFLGAFVLCKEVQERQECQYGENCTFAYCQEEIDVWTQERKGALSRELLFDPLGSTERRALSVTRLLQLHMGMFMFLCEECFDSKPRIISKRSKENLAVCSNLTARHPFDDNKCLVHVVRSANVRYSKVRPLHPLCQFDVCRHEVRYGCQREDSCSFAHSVIELKCWVLQQDTGITHEEMVQESKRHWQRLEQNAQKQGRPLNLKMKFVCGQCWREGQVNEPDKNLKYCTAKARHSWTKERRVLLVKSFEKKKWVVVRPLPFSRTYPQQYDMCVHVMKQKKCHYIGNCSFAHSLEERDVWTYMKNNSCKLQLEPTNTCFCYYLDVLSKISI
uniref:Zinc finger CCCH-type containing 7Bb n=1 Tax=Sphaeramia orbicularis TaxID=375764 RepID=A0A673AJV2_9TELE